MGWCSPIMWHDNISLPQDLYEQICTSVKGKINNIPQYYTTYGKKNPEWDRQLLNSLVEFYTQLFVDKPLMELGLNYRSDWEFNFWIQATNSKSTGHKPHNHFSGNEFISWCHIIKALPNERCFYFLRNVPSTSELVGGNNMISVANRIYEKIYPEQMSGDINAWPAWSLHGVDSPSTEESRIVIAGNIAINTLTDGESIVRGERTDSEYHWQIT